MCGGTRRSHRSQPALAAPLRQPSCGCSSGLRVCAPTRLVGAGAKNADQGRGAGHQCDDCRGLPERPTDLPGAQKQPSSESWEKRHPSEDFAGSVGADADGRREGRNDDREQREGYRPAPEERMRIDPLEQTPTLRRGSPCGIGFPIFRRLPTIRREWPVGGRVVEARGRHSGRLLTAHPALGVSGVAATVAHANATSSDCRRSLCGRAGKWLRKPVRWRAPSAVPKAAATTVRPSAPPLSPLAILGKITGGYKFTPNPRAEAALAKDPATAGSFVRSMNRRCVYLGVLSIKDNGRKLSTEESRDALAGAEQGGKTQGSTRRTELAGVRAVETTRSAGGGKIWSIPVDRYVVIVAGTAKEADDIARQLAAILQR